MKKLKYLLQLNKFFITVLIITVIYSLLVTNFIKYESKYNINNSEFTLYITKYKVDSNKLNLELKGKEKLIGNYYFKSIKERDNFYKNYNIGDKILVKGKLNIPSNNTIPNTFNYKKYLYNKRIFYALNIDEFKIINKNKSILYEIKDYVYKRLDNIKYNEYLYAFILGEKSYIDSSTYETYNSNGITHLFALSGLNVSMLSFIVLNILKKFKITETKKYIIIFFLLFIICFITDFPSSIVRASFFFIFIYFNKKYNLNIKTDNLLILLCNTLLIINPFVIYELSFKLSFTTTYFILINSKWFGKKYIKSLIRISYISFLGSLPIIASNFYSVNLLSIINNIFFVPFVSVIIYPVSLITFIIPKISYLLKFLVEIMEIVSNYINQIKLFNLNIPKLNIFTVIIYYIFMLLYSYNKRFKYLLIMIIVIFINSLCPLLDKNTYIYFCDVGQGDSTLIVTKNNESILIDTGGVTNYINKEFGKRNSNFSLMKNTLIPFYKSIGINKINYLFLTHGDYDHIGEAINLVNNFKVDRVIFNSDDYNKLENDLIKVLDKKNIKYYKNIKELNVDDNKLYFLNNKLYDNENDNSNVIYFNYNGIKFLFMGDAGVEREKDILKKYNLSNIDFLKVGHHGSKTSSSEKFINSINSKYSLISVEANNRYGHPNSEVLDILNNSKIYRTDQDGSILIKIKNNKYKIYNYAPYKEMIK